MKRIICLLLVLVMTALALASCGKSKDAATTTAKETAQETTASATAGQETAEATTATPTTVPVTTADPFVAIGEEVRALSAPNRNIKIQLSAFGNAEKVSKNDKYVAGPDAVEEGETPEIQVMVFERNRAANELLGTTVAYSYWSDLGWDAQWGRIETLVKGQDPDAPDVFVDMIFDLGVATTKGLFKDVWSIPGSYFDFDAAGWMGEWMESMSLSGDRAYIMAGDYFLDVMRAMGVLPFNMTMMDANADLLAAAILPENETLAPGEELSARFFDFVEEGKWTWDTLTKLSAAIWRDVDNSGDDTIGDRLGFLGSGRTNMSSSLYLYSNSDDLFDVVEHIEDPSSEYNGKRWIYYPDDPGVLGDIFDAIYALFDGKGTMAPNYPNEGATILEPGLAYHWIKFGEGGETGTLFAGCCVLGALEDEAFQNMTDLYSVVPIPKLRAEGEYNTVIHNVGDAGAMNVNAHPDKAKAVSAFLQYCTVHSGEIREEFLQIVTKYRTTVYNQGTDRMFDIIYSRIVDGRDKSIEDMMRKGDGTSGKRWHVLIMQGNEYTHDSSFLASEYAAAKSAKQAYLDDLLAIWYTLPTVEPAAE
ncbi:MAG: hypothetical protein IKP55_05225 [Clostridia bacterium]|nr:hypothetical protein [Clostridia bacterium]